VHPKGIDRRSTAETDAPQRFNCTLTAP
jgi:hypothetical protein